MKNRRFACWRRTKKGFGMTMLSGNPKKGLNTMESCGSTAMAAFYISQEKLKDKAARRMYYGCVFKAKKEMPV